MNRIRYVVDKFGAHDFTWQQGEQNSACPSEGSHGEKLKAEHHNSDEFVSMLNICSHSTLLCFVIIIKLHYDYWQALLTSQILHFLHQTFYH